MVWGCIANSGVGRMEFIEPNMDTTMYLNILKTNLKQSAEELPTITSSSRTMTLSTLLKL